MHEEVKQEPVTVTDKEPVGEKKSSDKEKQEEKFVPRLGPDGKELMHVKLYSPFRTYYDDDAYSVSAVNRTGPFDILPRHHNFMTLLNDGYITVRSPGGDKKIKISHAIMHVKKDKVTIFLDV